jgi:hypothetical protein
MRIGGMWRLAVLASLALHVSGQLCMITTCVPRLAQLRTAEHACCSTPAAAEGPAAPMPAGAMPCDQQSSLADSPSLDAPQPLPAAVLETSEPAVLEAPAPALAAARACDAGPPPGRTGPAPAGLRAPPIA